MKRSLHIILGVTAGIINCIFWYILSKSKTCYAVDSIELNRLLFTIASLFIGIFLVVFIARKQNNGVLEFKDGFKKGITYAISLAMILAVFHYFYYKFIAPDVIDYYVNERTHLDLLAKKIKTEDLVKSEKDLRSYFSPFRMLMTTVMQGLIISLIAAGIFRKKGPTLPFSEN